MRPDRGTHVPAGLGSRRPGLPAFICLLVAGALLLAGCSSPPPAARGPLVLGAVLALTGTANSEGPQQDDAIRLEVSQINAAGGIDGAQLQVVIRNDNSSPALAVTLTRQLITQDHVLAIIGPTTSDAATTADPVADQMHVPVIAVSNVINGVVGHCAYPCTWVWRDSLADAIAVPDAVSIAVQTVHPRAAAIVYSAPDLLGQQDASAAASAFRAMSVPVVADDSAPESSGNLRAVLSRTLAGKPAVLFIGSVSAQFISLAVHTARSLGFTGTFVGGNTMNSSTTAALMGAAGVGALSGAGWTRHSAFPANAAFVSDYQAAFGSLPDEFSADAYAAVEILAAALRTAAPGWTADTPVATRRAGIQSALPRTALMTPLGEFRFTADHDVSQLAWIVATAANGEHTLAGFCDPGC